MALTVAGTTLNLLTRDGVVTVTFDGQLSHDHYGQLSDSVRGAESRQLLKDQVSQISSHWGIGVTIVDDTL